MREFWKQVRAKQSTRALLKAAARHQRLGDFDELRAMIASHEGNPHRHVLHAMLARSYSEHDNRVAATEEFSKLYAATKSDREQFHYVKLYALFNLALLRNSPHEAVHYSQKARALLADTSWKKYLPIPRMELQPRAWATITATQ